MSEVRLQVKNLCKNFGITKAVQNVSFNVNKGEVHALIGENGSGKSTLTNMLTGIYSIGSGQFILDGKEIHPKNQVEANNLLSYRNLELCQGLQLQRIFSLDMRISSYILELKIQML